MILTATNKSQVKYIIIRAISNMLTVNRRQFVFAGIILAGTLFGIYFDPFFSDDNVSLRAS